MQRLVVLVASLWLVPSTASATWSILAVDRSTGRVVLGSASCVNTNDEFMKQALAVVVPGKGVAACQATSDMTHENQMLVFAELQKGTDPKHIIELLSVDPNFQSRQFGILDLQVAVPGIPVCRISTSRSTWRARCRGRRFSMRSRPTPCVRAASSPTPFRIRSVIRLS